MSYKHILVAVDLTQESKALIDKSLNLAKPLKAEVSFIHVDPRFEELYHHSGILDADLDNNGEFAAERSRSELKELAKETDYPIKNCLVGTGDYGCVIKNVISKYEVDLFVCGHHRDFLSQIFSSTKPILNQIGIDTLVIPIVKDA